MSIRALDDKVYAISDNKRASLRDLLAAFRRHGAARVTDLHMKTGQPPIYRVDGQLKRTQGAALDADAIRGLIESLLSKEEWDTLQRVRSVNNSHLIDGTRYRLNAFYDHHGLAAAIRALETAAPDIEDIGFPNGVWEDIVNLRQGLVLLTGATGAGKSTTIAALLGRIAQTRPCHIITLENPIEYELDPGQAIISQRALGRDVPNYEQGLRDCLREDPDVIFVGEMTDAESTQWTLTAAETGHLVFSSLHTRDASSAVTRILDMYPPGRGEEIAGQLSMALAFVISQKLLPRAGDRGRLLAMEILNVNFAVANQIRQMKLDQIYTVMQTNTRDAPGQRMRTLERSLVELLRAGEITRQEAERAANHPGVLNDELEKGEEE